MLGKTVVGKQNIRKQRQYPYLPGANRQKHDQAKVYKKENLLILQSSKTTLLATFLTGFQKSLT
jgi:hypothetical protein